jgi:hypothetical protein
MAILGSRLLDSSFNVIVASLDDSSSSSTILLSTARWMVASDWTAMLALLLGDYFNKCSLWLQSSDS